MRRIIGEAGIRLGSGKRRSSEAEIGTLLLVVVFSLLL
jgi:hypothetical protein